MIDSRLTPGETVNLRILKRIAERDYDSMLLHKARVQITNDLKIIAEHTHELLRELYWDRRKDA